MRNLIFVCLFLASCASNKALDKVNNKELVLKEAYSQNITGGKESVDGTHSSNNYNFVFEAVDNIEIKAVWINKIAYKFETFKHKGLFYVSVQVFSKNTDNVVDMKIPINTKAKGLIMYRINESNYYFEVEDFKTKSITIGK